MKAKDIMTCDVLTVERDAPILDAARLMLQRRISGLPVVDGTGNLVGIMTEGDFLRRSETETQRRRPRWIEFFVSPGRLAEDYAHASGRKVYEVMTSEVHVASEDMPLEDIVRQMERHRIKRLPVMAGKRLVGIVTRADLLRAVADAAQDGIPLKPGDQDIGERLLTELKKQPWVPLAVNVGVKDGVVKLSGLISDERQRQVLCVAAENVPGVKKIDDRLSLVDPATSGVPEPAED